jgi:hypothetical protein
VAISGRIAPRSMRDEKADRHSGVRPSASAIERAHRDAIR